MPIADAPYRVQARPRERMSGLRRAMCALLCVGMVGAVAWADEARAQAPAPAAPPSTQPASASTQLAPNPAGAAATRSVAAANRRKANQLMEINRAAPEPQRTAIREEAEAFEQLVSALEALADAQELGDNDKVIELNRKQMALTQKARAATERTEAAREETLLRSTIPVDNLKRIAEPTDMAQIEQLASIRLRAADAWADYRRSFATSPEGRGSIPARVEAAQLTLTASRFERVMSPRMLASKLQAKAKTSDTPDLMNRMANDLLRSANELDAVLEKQIELKARELELEAKQKRLEEEARASLR